MFSKPLAAALLLSGAMLAAQPVLAQDSATEPAAEAVEENAVIARVNGDEIRQSDLIAFIQTLPPQLQGQAAFLMPQLVQQLVNNALVTDAGRKADLAEDAEVQARLNEIEGIIIRQTFIQRTIDARVTEARLTEAYGAYIAENPPQPQLVARHILVETEEAAKALIVELDGGADFAALAQEHSTGPSKTNGGQLPPFSAGEMVPEFSEAAFAMDVGSYSAEPVQTQFGFHIIKLEESRMSEPPTLGALEGQLREQVSQEVVEELYAELREQAEVEVLLGGPEPAEEAAPEAAPETAPGETAPEEAPEAAPETNN